MTVVVTTRTVGILLLLMSFYCAYNIYSIVYPSEYGHDASDIWHRELDDRRVLWQRVIDSIETQKKEHRVPDVIGIGVRKCGTGAFQYFLGNHPLMQVNGEVHFYDKEDVKKGIEYYKSVLKPATKKQLIMEKTPAYFTTLPAELPEIIKRDSPNVKLIILLCNPVDRSISDFAQRKTNVGPNTINKTFEEYFNEYFGPVQKTFSSLTMNDNDSAVADILAHFKDDDTPQTTFAYGIYAYFIRRWLKVFSQEQFLIVNGEEFLKDPGSVYERVQDFLNIPKLLLKNDFVRHPQTRLFCLRPWWDKTYDYRSEFLAYDSCENGLHCTGESKGRTRSGNKMYQLDKKISEKLKRFYQPYNEALYRILGKRYEW